MSVLLSLTDKKGRRARGVSGDDMLEVIRGERTRSEEGGQAPAPTPPHPRLLATVSEEEGKDVN